MAERVGFVRLRALRRFGGTSRVGEPSRSSRAIERERRRMAERVGFEPTCPLRDKTLSRRPRYDHFGTSPQGQRASGYRRPATARFSGYRLWVRQV